MIEAIAPLSSLAEIAPANNMLAPAESGQRFIDLLGQGVGTLNHSLDAADSATRALAAGTDMPVHDVMIALEQARLDMQFAVQVRNRVVAAYHDIVSMQV
ncbi:flagellar hook-basal body complex protein FliE [Dyella silvatica]|uniref:flagellar hook-basal body complex protein FliE n=1 Tax=Dyella silvatica TaxID=2992128 RepID=UPI00224E5C61|nr:flagellar hook-basal body complex protein FliE [Dyella silvatica]